MVGYKEYLKGIRLLHDDVIKAAQERADNLAKPLGSLGKLEKIAVQLAGITGEVKNNIHKKCVIVMSADNGIVEEGVASTPQNVTLIQSINMVKKLTGISALSKQANADVKVIDIGINSDVDYPGIVNKKIRKGTANFAKGPAMTREEVETAINIGIEITSSLIHEGYDLLGTGEMGIGNTSTSSAVVMSLTDQPAAAAVGKGGGLTDEAFENKKRVIEKGIKLNCPDKNDPIDVLSKVGGLDIAGLVGCYIAAAYHRVPIVMDGVISATAAMVATELNPAVKAYIIPSHASLEPAYNIIINKLDMNPLLLMDMRLGEGTGCPLTFHIIESACSMMNHMATFEEATIDNKYLVDIR